MTKQYEWCVVSHLRYNRSLMENLAQSNETLKFSSPEEELKYLREKVAENERSLPPEALSAKPEAVISQTLTEYAKNAGPAQTEAYQRNIENPQYEKALERMASLPHREKMRELYIVLAEKGVLASIRYAQALASPHLEDDFHGVLVEYIRTGAIVPGLEKERGLNKNLGMTVYEVTLPFAGMQEGDKTRVFKEIIAEMERFYIGMTPIESAPLSNYGPISLELVLSNFSNDLVLYISVEKHMKDLLIKQLLSAFPSAKIEEHLGDYNIFNEFGVSVASYAEVTEKFVYPININEESEQDPFHVILNSFTKIERDGEGAAIQLMIYPDTDKIAAKIKYAIGQIRQGIPVKRAIDIPLTTGRAITKTLTEFFHTQINNDGKKREEVATEKEADEKQKAIALMDEKVSAPLLRANLRVIVSAATRDRADAIRTAIESAFSQFTRTQSNGLKFTHVENARLQKLLHYFIYRMVDEDEVLVMNTKELSAIYHLPAAVSQKDAPQLKTVKSSSAPPPSDLPHEGTIIGISNFRGEKKEIRLTNPDRLRHLYTLGQTGAGKSVFLQNLAVQDILAGNGVCFIDPHGSDVLDILSCVPKERIDDVIYFDPSYVDRPLALNMLEYDPAHPEQKIFVVNEMLAIFKKLYSSSPESMGPAFEQYFRNATMLVMEDPETGNTLLEIPRVLADANFRNLKLSRCKNPIVVQFWRDIATKTSGESGLQNMIPYITNKFDVFISNDIMRPIIAQEKSSFNFRDIMDNKKILLVNLAKGKLGEMNANLIGLIIIGKFLMAAMSRVDSFGGPKLPDFYLYVDEFQNVATPSISTILSEARKYGLSLNLAHQFIDQLPEDIKSAVFGNVGNMVLFRVGTADAEFLEPQLAPIFKASDIMKQENRNAYAKILINGKPVPPFNIEMQAPPKGNPEVVEQMKQLSYLKYGKDRKTVDDAILKKYLAPKTAAPAQPAAVSAPAMQQPQPQVSQQLTPSAAPVVTMPQVNPAPVFQAAPASPLVYQQAVQAVQTVPTVQMPPAVPSPLPQPLSPQQIPAPQVVEAPALPVAATWGTPQPFAQVLPQANIPQQSQVLPPLAQADSPFAKAFARADVAQSPLDVDTNI